MTVLVSIAPRALALCAVAAAASALAQQGPGVPSCTDLANDPAWGLAGNPAISGLTAELTPASGSTAAYCQVNFTDVTLAGPVHGYLRGQTSKFRIRVGLPLSAGDGGMGGTQGAWNGKVQSRGNGGFAGGVTSVTPATNAGYVGTGTDTGHNSSVTNPAPNPFAPPSTIEIPPSESGAAFGLNPDGTLNLGRIMDYAWRGQHHANLWGRRIAEIYYGQAPTRNYFVGCSDGGREGHEMAQRFGDEFDGIVAISPAIHWDRWGFSSGWGNYVANQLLGTRGLDAAKLADVNRRALAACDPIDGITDGMIQETRRCTYNAHEAVCGAPGASTDPALCLTAGEADVVNAVWDGPRQPNGKKLWVGWERGTQGIIGLADPVAGSPNLFGEQINRYWVHRDPYFNWRSIDMDEFGIEQINLTHAFSKYIGSDSPNLRSFKRSGGKLIASYGNLDQVIPPNGHYNYMQRLFAEMGGVAATQDFYRYYVFPNALHCSGSGMTEGVLFNALVDWVENGTRPDHLVAQVSPTRTRKVCMYPNTPRYMGTGSTDDQANFFCQHNATDDPALLAQEAGILQGEGPLRSNRDIKTLP